MRHYTKAEGYTLVELLIVMAIVGLVAAAVLGVYQVSQDIYIRASSLEAAQTGARAGLDRMANELRLIGSYWVGANGAGAITTATPSSITFRANVDDSSVVGGVEATRVCSPCLANASVTLSLTTGATQAAFRVYANTTLNDYIYIANGAKQEVKQITGTTIGSNTLPLASALGSPYPEGSIVRDVKTITYTRNAAATSTCQPLTCLTRTQGGSGADPIVDNVTNLTFTYFDKDGSPTTDLTKIREILISLTTEEGSGTGCTGANPNACRMMTTRVRVRNL